MSSKSTNIHGALAQAAKSLQKGQLAETVSICRRILKTHRDQPDALHLMGLTALRQADHERAVALIEKALLNGPQNISFQINLSEAYGGLGDYDKAVSTLRQALQVEPDRAEAHCSLGNALLGMEQPENALASYARAIELNAQLAPAYYNMGNAHFALGDFDSAIAAYRKAAEIRPEFSDAHFNLGNALSAKDELLAAVNAYEAALGTEPKFAKCWYNLGNALRKLGRLETARRSYEKAVEYDASLTAAHVHLGTIAKLQGRLTAALKELDLCIERDPSDSLALAERAHVLLLQGRKEDAIEGYRRAIAAEPRFAWAHIGLSTALAEDRRPREAHAASLRAIELRRTYAQAFLGRESAGRILVLKGIGDSYFVAGRGDTVRVVAGMANAFDQFDRGQFELSSFYLDGLPVGDEQAAVPVCDLIYNAIGDPDAMPECHEAATRIAAAISVPLLNRPTAVEMTRRQRLSQSLDGIDGLFAAKTVSLNLPVNMRDVARQLEDAGIAFPVLARRAGAHNTETLEKCEDVAALTRFVAGQDSRAISITEFVDYATDTGDYIKMRFHVIEGVLYPNHLWVSPNWKIMGGRELKQHMRANAWMLDASQQFCETPEDYLGRDAYAALAQVHARLPLDYFGIDFTRLRDGRILIFEANSVMRVAPESAGEFSFRNDCLRAISQATRALPEKYVGAREA